jgi:hypothetical protein
VETKVIRRPVPAAPSNMILKLIVTALNALREPAQPKR